MALSCIISEIKRDIGQKSSFSHTPLHSPPPLGGSPSEQCHDVWFGKTRMAWLPDGEKNLKIRLFVFTQLTNVTNRQTLHADIGCAYASHRVAKTKNVQFCLTVECTSVLLQVSTASKFCNCNSGYLPIKVTINKNINPPNKH